MSAFTTIKASSSTSFFYNLFCSPFIVNFITYAPSSLLNPSALTICSSSPYNSLIELALTFFTCLGNTNCITGFLYNTFDNSFVFNVAYNSTPFINISCS